jgi:hypothetical protein
VGCSPWTPRALRLGVSLLASKSSLCAGCRWSRLPSIDSRACARLVHRFGFTRPWIFLSPEFPLASRRSCFFFLGSRSEPRFRFAPGAVLVSSLAQVCAPRFVLLVGPVACGKVLFPACYDRCSVRSLPPPAICAFRSQSAAVLCSRISAELSSCDFPARI